MLLLPHDGATGMERSKVTSFTCLELGAGCWLEGHSSPPPTWPLTLQLTRLGFFTSWWSWEAQIGGKFKLLGLVSEVTQGHFHHLLQSKQITRGNKLYVLMEGEAKSLCTGAWEVEGFVAAIFANNLPQ